MWNRKPAKATLRLQLPQLRMEERAGQGSVIECLLVMRGCRETTLDHVFKNKQTEEQVGVAPVSIDLYKGILFH